jgi:sugar phosphate isomerase/epimerase
MVRRQIFINVPYEMLRARLDYAIQNRLLPEIYFDGNALDSARQEDVDRLAKTLSQHEIDVSLHGPYMDLSPGGLDGKVRNVSLDRIEKTIELAALFRPKTVVFHPSFDQWRFGGYHDLWLKNSLAAWKPIARRAEEIGTIVAIENVFEEEPQTLRDLIEGVNSPNFRFCFDTGHYFVFSKVPMNRWFELLGDCIAEVHLHDNHGTRDDHLPLGDGKMDFDEFFNLLGRISPQPILTVEPHDEAHLWSSIRAVEKYLSQTRGGVTQR